MKLVIDIPEEIIQGINNAEGVEKYHIPLWLCYSIVKGTPIKQTDTAEWLSQNGEYVCSECGYEVWGSGISVMNEWKHCPCCGRKIAE